MIAGPESVIQITKTTSAGANCTAVVLFSPHTNAFRVRAAGRACCGLPDTKRVMGLALEIARIAFGLTDDFANGIWTGRPLP